MAISQKTTEKYENNPLVVTVEGLKLIFNKAQQVAIFIAILIGVVSILSFLMQIAGSVAESTVKKTHMTTEQYSVSFDISLQAGEIGMIATLIVVGLVVYIGFVLVAFYINAITDYTAARAAEGKSVTLKEAAGAAWQKFGGYLWVMILSGLKLLAWTLLFIIPGIYKSVRYSLAGVSYFSDPATLRGDAAIQHSNRLTDGAWLTTFSSLSFFNILTGGLIEPLLTMSSKAVLFRQYKAHGDTPKPQAHILSWIGFLLPFILITLFILFVGGLIAVIAASGEMNSIK